MNAIEYIRRVRLGLSQTALAEIASVDQSTVSRWENGLSEPTRDQMGVIRAFALAQGIEWQDRWFFETEAA